MKVPAHGSGHTTPVATQPTIIIQMPKETKMPIGFAAWSTAHQKPKRKRTPKKAT